MGIKETDIDNANELLWQSRFNDSSKVISDALEILEIAENAGYQKGIAYANLNIATTHFYQSKNDIALKHLADSLHWFERNTNETGYIWALLLKGSIYESFGDYETSLELFLTSLKLSAQNNENETKAEAASQLGLLYTRLCNFGKADECFSEALAIREMTGDENGMASSLNRMGMLMRLTGKHEKSLEYYFKSLEIRRKNRQETSIPWTLLGIASTYEEMHDNVSALDYYERGLSGGDRRCTLQCMLGLGRINSREGNLSEAEKQLKLSLTIAQELKALSLVAEAYSALARHYESSGNVISALEYYKLFQKTKESVQSEEAQSRFRNIEISHAIEKSEQEKEIFRLRHVELKKAYDIIEEKNRDIVASINYASRIQSALLPDPADIKGLKKNLFILYLPKDIVSGDFYWFSEVAGKLVITAGDCTGHGVPGALMSMLGVSFLEEIVNNHQITDSGVILDELRKEIQRALRQRGEKGEAKDGMDLSLCVIDQKNKTIQYSGAYNNLYHLSDGTINEYEADRMPIGIFDYSVKNFSSTIIHTAPDDMIYMFSDGFADQFGGPQNKKFKYTPFKNLLKEIHKLPLSQQKSRLQKEFKKWKGNNQQTDDVVVLGFRV